MPLGLSLDCGEVGNTRWDDLSISATSVRIGALSKPDFDYTNIGLLFPSNDTSEKVYMVYQMSHRKRLGTAIKLHIHYVQTTVNKPVFRAEYRFYNNGGIVPSYTTINTSDVGGVLGEYPYTSGSMLQKGAFPAISAPANEGLSANLDVILYRNDAIAGDILVKYIDVHYEMDTIVSREEFSK